MVSVNEEPLQKQEGVVSNEEVSRPEEGYAPEEEKYEKNPSAKEEVKEAKPRPLDYVMVRHLGYSARTKVHRAGRPGQRKQRLMLDDGRHIRCKGDRYTEVSFTDLFRNFNTLLASVRSGTAEICRPDSLQALTVDQLADLGARLSKDYKDDLKIDKTLLEPLFADTTDKKVWEEKEDPNEDPNGEDLKDPEGKPTTQENQEAPANESQGEDEDPGKNWSQEEDEAAKAEEEEVNDEDSTVLSEEDLRQQSRNELNEMATLYGVESPEKLSNKQAVIDAILDAAEAEEQE